MRIGDVDVSAVLGPAATSYLENSTPACLNRSGDHKMWGASSPTRTTNNSVVNFQVEMSSVVLSREYGDAEGGVETGQLRRDDEVRTKDEMQSQNIGSRILLAVRRRHAKAFDGLRRSGQTWDMEAKIWYKADGPSPSTAQQDTTIS